MALPVCPLPFRAWVGVMEQNVTADNTLRGVVQEVQYAAVVAMAGVNENEIKAAIDALEQFAAVSTVEYSTVWKISGVWSAAYTVDALVFEFGSD